MERARFIKGAAIVLLSLSAFALIGFNVYQHYRIKQAAQGVSGKDLSADEAATDRSQDKGGALSKDAYLHTGEVDPSGKTEAEALRYQVDAAKEELETAKGRLADEETKKAAQAKISAEIQKKQDEITRSRRKASMESDYALLFKDLHLSPEALERLKEVMLDEEEASIETSIVSKAGNMSVAVARSVDPGDGYQERIRELLGEGDYARYQAFKERIGQVYVVTGFNESLSSVDALTDAQQSSLIDAMYEVREKVTPDQDDDEEEDDDLSMPNFTEEEIAEDIKRSEHIQERYIKAAKGILTETQKERLKAYFKKQRDEQETNMRMISRMNLSQAAQTDEEKKTE